MLIGVRCVLKATLARASGTVELGEGTENWAKGLPSLTVQRSDCLLPVHIHKSEADKPGHHYLLIISLMCLLWIRGTLVLAALLILQ